MPHMLAASLSRAKVWVLAAESRRGAAQRYTRPPALPPIPLLAPAVRATLAHRGSRANAAGGTRCAGRNYVDLGTHGAKVSGRTPWESPAFSVVYPRLPQNL